MAPDPRDSFAGMGASNRQDSFLGLAASSRLLQADRFEPGAKIWVEGEEDGQAWALAEVLRQENTILHVVGVQDKVERPIDLVSGGVAGGLADD
jgi:hypothetical protein